MDVFKDEVYEEMDDISKLIEPFEYSINNEMAQFPDEIVVDDAILLAGIGTTWYDSLIQESIENIVRSKALELNLNALAREMRVNWGFCKEMFEIEARPDEEDGDMFYDATTGELSGGTIAIVKRKIAVEDKDIEASMANYAFNALQGAFLSSTEVNKKNLNQLADLFGAKEAREERKWRSKVTKLGSFYRQLVINRQLQIKDFELFKRFISWNILYIKNGSLPAMANIAKLKIMMRSGNPIYSLKEEQV